MHNILLISRYYTSSFVLIFLFTLDISVNTVYVIVFAYFPYLHIQITFINIFNLYINMVMSNLFSI